MKEKQETAGEGAAEGGRGRVEEAVSETQVGGYPGEEPPGRRRAGTGSRSGVALACSEHSPEAIGLEHRDGGREGRPQPRLA